MTLDTRFPTQSVLGQIAEERKRRRRRERDVAEAVLIPGPVEEAPEPIQPPEEPPIEPVEELAPLELEPVPPVALPPEPVVPPPLQAAQELERIRLTELDRLAPAPSLLDVDITLETAFGVLFELYPGFPPLQIADTQQLLNDLFENLGTDPEGFLFDLRTRGTPEQQDFILRLLGVSVADLILARKTEEEISDLVSGLFPGMTELSEVADFGTEKPDEFAARLRLTGFTPETVELLKLFDLSPHEIAEFFATSTRLIEVDGFQQLLTITPNGQAFDINGVWVGTYNNFTHEYTSMAPESWFKDTISDPFVTSIRGMVNATAQFWLTTVPDLLFRPQTEAERRKNGPALSGLIDANNQALRDRWRGIAADIQQGHDALLIKNPQLQPKPEWREGHIVSHPGFFTQTAELLSYSLWLFSNSLPYTLASVGTYSGLLLTTGNPVLAAAGTVAVLTPVLTQEVKVQLVSAGMAEGDASALSVPVGVILSTLELVGDMPFFKALFPRAWGSIRQAYTRELGALLRGVKTGGAIITSEVLTENAQQALINLTVKLKDKDREIFGDIREVTTQTILAMLPLAALGGGVTMVRASPAASAALSELHKNQRGWLRDPTGDWWVPELSENATPEQRASFDLANELLDDALPGTEQFAEVPDVVVEEVAAVEEAAVVAPELAEEAVVAPLEAVVPEAVVVPEVVALTPQETTMAVEQFAELIADPQQRSLWERTLKLRTEERATRAAALGPRTRQLVSEGLGIEEALKQAEKDVLSGALPSAATNIPQLITDTIRPALFAQIDQKLTGFERASTRKALTNALAGKPIPRILGIKGGSALTRLQAVFPQPIIDALEHPGGLEGFLEDNMPHPVGVSDQGLRDYLRSLPTSEQAVLNRPDVFGERGPGQTPASREQALRLEPETVLGEEIWHPPDPLVIPTEAERIAQVIDIRIAMGQVPRGVPGGVQQVTPGTARELALFPADDRTRLWDLAKASGMTIVDFFNFIRAMRASFDLSAWRQVSPMIVGNFNSFLVGSADMFRAAWSADHVQAVSAAIQRDTDFALYEQLTEPGKGDFLRPFDAKAVKAWERQEEFIIQGQESFFGRLADKMPFIRISSRAHITMINKMLFDIWKKQVAVHGGASAVVGDPQARENLRLLAEFFAEMSGRGPLGPFKTATPIINAFVFAPRFTVGRLFSIRWLVSANPYIRKQAWKNWLTFIGAGFSVLAAGAAMGVWEVEDDPRNTDFGKIRIGGLRIDFWGGVQQYVTLFARLISGEQISSTTGMVRSVDLLDTLQHWSRGKGSPLSQWLLEVATGETFLGDELDLADVQQWMERIAPFALIDIYEAFEEEGLAGVFWGALPAIFGSNVAAYGSDFFEQFRDKLGLPVQEADPVPEVDGKPVTIEEQRFYDMGTYAGDINRRITGVPQEDITLANFPADWVHYAETRENRIVMNGLSNIKPIGLNTDAEKGNSLAEFKLQGDLIAAEKDPDLKAALRLEFPNAITGIMHDNLIEYHIIKNTGTNEQLDAFLEEHPELQEVPRREWLAANPTENANLALWGYAPLASVEAAAIFEGLVERLDISEDWLPKKTLPPIESLETHFAYLDEIAATSATSWEAQLILKKDQEAADLAGRQSYVGWRSAEGAPLTLTDNSVELLELAIGSRELFTEYEAEEDSEKKLQLREDNPGFDRFLVEMKGYQPHSLEELLRVFRITPEEEGKFDLLREAVVRYGQPAVKNAMSSEEVFEFTFDIRGADWKEDEFLPHYVHWGNEFWKGFEWLLRKDRPEQITRVRETLSDYDNAVFDALFEVYEAETLGRDIFPEKTWRGLLYLTVNHYRDGAERVIELVEAIGVPNQWDRIKDELRAIPHDKPDTWPEGVAWYEDDWFLMDNIEFYRAARDAGLIQPADFRTVPTRQVFATYRQYLNLDVGFDRLAFRQTHADLEKWLVLKFDMAPIEDRGTGAGPEDRAPAPPRVPREDRAAPEGETESERLRREAEELLERSEGVLVR